MPVVPKEILERNRKLYNEKVKHNKTKCPYCDKEVITKFYRVHCQTIKHRLRIFEKKEEDKSPVI
jgi:hypothetical protein